MSKRLLAVSWELPPLAGPRAIQVSRTLATLGRFGWSSTVVCVEPRPGGPLLRDTAAGEPWEAAGVPGVDIERVASREETGWARAAFRLVPALGRFPDRQRLWVAPASRAAGRRLAHDRYDVLMSFAQPWSVHLVGLHLRRAHRCPWVAHFSDPWTDSPYLDGPLWLRKRWARMEAAVVSEADAVIFTTEQAVDAVMRKYPAHWRRKAHVVPHGYDRTQLALVATDQRPPDGRLRLVYAGRFYDGLRTPSPLLNAIARARARGGLGDEIELLLVGPGMSPYEAQARRLGLERIVSIVPRVPYLEALQLAATADVLLVIEAPSRTPSPFLPSKLVDDLMLRKPILGLTPCDGASADLLRALRCPVVPPDDVEAIAGVLERLVDAWRSRRLGISDGFDHVAAAYDIEQTTARLAQILDTCR